MKVDKEFAHVPKALIALDRWLVWKYLRPKEPGGKRRKCPWDLATGSGLDATRISNGRPFADIVAAYRAAKPGSLAGIGFILGDGIGGTDCDDCIDPEGALNVVGRAQADAFVGTYAEVSPSGKGFKTICLLDERVGYVSKKVDKEELYTAKRWFAITGKPLPGYESKAVLDMSDAFLAMAERLRAQNVTDADDIDPIPANPGDHFLRFHVPGMTLKRAFGMLLTRDPDCSNAAWRNRYMLAWALQFGIEGLPYFDDWSSRGWKYPGSDEVAKEYGRCLRDNAKLSPKVSAKKVSTLASLRFDVEGEKVKKSKQLKRNFFLETGTEIMDRGPVNHIPVLGPLFSYGVQMFAGLGGTGKSTLLATGAAHVSNGKPLPPWETPDTKREQAGVLWLTVEEDMRGLVAPRHKYLGGDLDLFYRPKIESQQDEFGDWYAVDFDIETDLPGLLDEAKARGTPIRLVVCDSLPGLIQWGESRTTTSDTDVKQIIGRLNAIAIEHECCIAGIAHWNKKSKEDESLRMSGSQAWRDTPRISFTIERGYIYVNKANEIPEIGCTFQQEVVKVLREYAAVTEDGKPLPVAARRAVFGEFLMSKNALLETKQADAIADPSVPGSDRSRLDVLCAEAREILDLLGAPTPVPSSTVWKAMYSEPNGKEKKQICDRLGLRLDKTRPRRPVLVSIV